MDAVPGIDEVRALLVEDELRDEWARAVVAWLKSRRARGTKQGYWTSVRTLLEHLKNIGKPLHRVVPSDIQDWMDVLAGEGLSSATVSVRLAGVRSFYRYVTTKHWIISSDGNQRPLGQWNPAAAADPPRISAVRQVTYLTGEETARLLQSIPRETVHGKQAYALFLSYLLTGRRNQEIRTLRQGDIRAHDGQMQYHWANKGKERWDPLPEPAWRAIEDYLRAAGRWGAMEPGDYIFYPLSDRATRFPAVKAQGWTQNRPLSGKYIGALLNKYVRRAGITKSVHVHSLRHTFAEGCRAAGMSIHDAQKLLGHSSSNTTERYFDHIEGVQSNDWQAVVAAWGIEVG